MKILFISRSLPYLGGRERIVEELMTYFKDSDRISLITPDKGMKRRNIKTFDSEESSLSIDKFVRKQAPEIISCHTFYLVNLAIRLSKKFNVPLIFTLHGVFIKFYDKDYSSIIKKIYKNSDIVTTVSENYKKQLSKFLKEGSFSKIEIIKNGVNDLQSNYSKKKKNIVRRKFRLPLDKKIVIIPARLNKIKGIDYAIKAAKEINEDILFLISSPKGRKNKDEIKFKKDLKNLIGRNNRVKFISLSHNELLEIYPACDVCLLPSLIEGISLSVLEAMSSGLVVATTAVGGNIEIINSGKNGFLFKPKSYKEIIKVVDI